MPSSFHSLLYTIPQAIGNALLAQRRSAFMWCVVAFAAGIILYFSFDAEPSLGLLGAGLVAVTNAALLLRKKLAYRIICVGLICLVAGMFMATWHTARQGTIVLERALLPKTISGTIEAIEFLPTGQRITLSDVVIDTIDADSTPAKVRLSMRAKNLADLSVGMRISLRAGLLPPMGPILRGGFDFARYFYFRGIGAVGYGMNPITIEKPADIHGFWAWWEDARVKLTKRIRAALSPEHAAIASGLITGDDAGISNESYEALKAANLLHIIAISGSHMVVIAGVVFFSMRMVLLLIPAIGQRVVAKQIAAAITMVAISAYLCITGVDISALRAYIMAMLVLLSVLAAREVQPMRALLMTAAIMLMYDPSDMLEPGFQLSFAATMAMLAVAQAAWVRDRNRGEHSIAGRMLYALPWLALISMIAEWVTAPLVMHMFNQFSVYGIVSNMIAGPVVSFLIMPAVALFFVLLPLGLDGVALSLLDVGIGFLLDVSRMVAGWEGALRYVPSQPAWAMAVYALALAFLCLWHGRLRLLAIPVMVACTMSFMLVKFPVMIVSQDMRHVVLFENGMPYLAHGRNYAMVPEMLAHAMGQETLLPMPVSDRWHCEGKSRTLRCIWRTDAKRVLFDFTWDKSGSVCELAHKENATMLITDAYGVRCDELDHLRVLTPYDRRTHGAYSWWPDTSGWQVLTTRMIQGNRPWNNLRSPNKPQRR